MSDRTTRLGPNLDLVLEHDIENKNLDFQLVAHMASR